MAADLPSAAPSPRDAALESIAASAQANIPGVDFASITVRDADGGLRTLAATDPLAQKFDALQYDLQEGPCYSAVTEERFVLVNDLAAGRYARYGQRAAELGVRAQTAIQLIDGTERAGLNLYSREAGVFDRATLQLAELFATQAAALLQYAVQVEHLGEALHSRTDIGTAVSIVMERYDIDRNQAFGFLVRYSNDHNVKLRVVAQQVVGGSFASTPQEDKRSQAWP